MAGPLAMNGTICVRSVSVKVKCLSVLMLQWLIPSQIYDFRSNQDTFNEWMFGKRFKEDSLVLDSFVAIPLAAKLSVAAVPGKYHDKRLFSLILTSKIGVASNSTRAKLPFM